MHHGRSARPAGGDGDAIPAGRLAAHGGAFLGGARRAGVSGVRAVSVTVTVTDRESNVLA